MSRITQTKRILNLYAGIGGNRKGFEIAAKKLGLKIEVTAVELDPEIAAEYKRNWPHDNVLVEDAYNYLLWNYEHFDFIWSSPSCLTFTNINYVLHNQISEKYPKGNRRYPELNQLYGQIIILSSFFKGDWIVENVKPFFINSVTPFMESAFQLNRHYYWSNRTIKGKYSQSDFTISGMQNKRTKRKSGRKSSAIEIATKDKLIDLLGITLSKEYKGNSLQVLRNCVVPDDAEYIFQQIISPTQKLEAWF